MTRGQNYKAVLRAERPHRHLAAGAAELARGGLLRHLRHLLTDLKFTGLTHDFLVDHQFD